MKIKDLIEIPDVETVIQFNSVLERDKTELKKILTSFVVTEDVEKDFIKFFSSIMENQGAGYFLKGSYGSGKSHFLSALALMLQYSEMRKFIFEQTEKLNNIKAFLTEKKYIVVKVPLILYSGQTKLEDVVFRAIESELEILGINVNLSDASKTVDNFFKLTSDYVRNKFKQYLKQSNENNFEKLSIASQANLIKKFVITQNIPLQFIYNRNDIFSKLFNILQETSHSGVIILIDELSEFLRGKSGNSKVDEDIRFLQFIGESTGNYPLWIIGAIQEELREISNISDKIFTKIKDRYKNRLELTTTHLEELIEKKLIIKKSGVKQYIENLRQKLEKNFSLMSIDKNRFYNLYPVLNPTLLLLQSIANIFSKQRGIVDFIHYQIKGDKKRNIHGIMNDNYETVITPDKIFDHFENNIQEFIDTNPYYEIVYKYYKNNISTVFPDTEEQKLALRLIKILILIQIAPAINSQSVKSIVHMLLYNYNSIDSMLNYEYIYKNFIKRFISDMDYIVETERDNFVNNIISVSISVNVNQIIKNKYNLIFKTLTNKENIIINYILKNIKLGFIDFENSINNTIEKRIYFQNTERKIAVSIQDLSEITQNDIIKYIESTDKDNELFILIGKPAIKNTAIKEIYKNLNKSIQANIVIWLPEIISDNNINTLKEFYTYNMILQQYIKPTSDSDKQIIDILKNKITGLINSVREIIQNSYLNGLLLLGGNIIQINKFKVALYDYDKALEYIAEELLSVKYPLHKKIAPNIKSYNIFQLKETVKKFIIPNEITRKEADFTGILSVIEGILLPLKLAVKQGNTFFLKPSPTKSDFILDYLSLISNNSIEADKIYNLLRIKGYGINKIMFIFVTAALISSGLITARKNNRLINPDKFDFYSIATVGNLEQGEIVSSDIHSKFKNINFIDTRLKNEVFNLDTQNRLWNYIVEFKKQYYNKFISLENNLQDLTRYSIFRDNNIIDKLQDKLKFVIDILNNIKVSYNSSNGLTNFISAIDDFDKLNFAIDFINKFSNLINFHIQEYMFFMHYLQKVHIPEKFNILLKEKNDIYNEITNIENVINTEFEIIKEKFKNFQEEYIKTYISEHNNYYKNINFTELKEIKNSVDYKLLEFLNTINLISVENDLLNINEKINFYSKKECKGVEVDNLYGNKPVCNCGYILGMETFKINTNAIMKSISRGIIQYLTELKENEYFEKLTVYITGLRQIKKDDTANSLEQLLNIDINKPINKTKVLLKQILNRELINEINKALEGETIIVKRDVRNFINKIVGKNFSKNKLMKLFNEWIDGKEEKLDSENTYIAVIDSEKKNNSIDTELANKIKDIFPDNSIDEGIKFLLIIEWLINFEFNIEKTMFSLTGINIKNIYPDKLKTIYNSLADKIKTSDYITPDEIEKLWELLDIDNKNLDEKIPLLYKNNIFKNLKLKILRSIIQEIILNKNEILIPQDRNINDDEIFKILTITAELIKIYNKRNEFNKYNDINKWTETVFIENISKIDLLLTLFSNFNNKYELITGTLFNQFRKEMENIINTEWNRFKNLLKDIKEQNNMSNWKIRHIKKTDEKSVIFLFDGMRWDLWKYYRKILKNSDLKITFVEENYQYAVPPTNTYVQRYALFHGEYKPEKDITAVEINNPAIFGDNCIWLNCAEYDYKQEKIKNILGTERNIVILGIGFIDDKLHSEKFDIATFYNELDIIFTEKILPLFEIFDKTYNFYILADHGFMTQLNWGRRGDIRYYHGGNSPWEIIVPNIKLKKGV